MRRVCWFWSSETAWYGTLSEEIRMELFLLFILIVCFVSYREIAEASDSPKLFEWYKEIDGADALPNAYYVEEACVYWAGLIRILPGSPGPYCIRGQYPKARFFSLGTYHNDIPVDVLYDFQIMPDKGSLNPFSSRNQYPADGKNLFYTVTLVEVSGIEDIPRNNKPSNVLYVTRQKGQNNDYYIFLYRVYWDRIDPAACIPDGCTRRQWEKQGQKPLPEVVMSGLRCETSRPGNSRIRPEFTDAEYSRMLARFRKSVEDAGSHIAACESSGDCRWGVGNPKIGFGNSAAVYLMAHLDDCHGEVAVVRFKAPTFPDTNRGDIIDPSVQQTRYWSVCTHIPGTMTTIACLSDCDFIIDDGYATLVLSTEDKRPDNAPNWLPYGWDEHNQCHGALVFLRNLLPSPALFPESPYFYSEVCGRFHSPLSSDYRACLEDTHALACFTGDYYPHIYYCSRREFETGSPAGK